MLYCVRHGQTDWNVERRLQGQKDIPLNACGRRQAAGNGRRLRDLLGEEMDRFDFVASPLGRTRETMELLREAAGLDPLRYRLDDRLKELSFGDWEGSTLEEVADREPALVAERTANKWSFLPPGPAESYAALARRVEPWYREVKADTICVTHGGTIRTLLYLVGATQGNAAAEMDIRQDRVLRLCDGAQWL